MMVMMLVSAAYILQSSSQFIDNKQWPFPRTKMLAATQTSLGSKTHSTSKPTT